MLYSKEKGELSTCGSSYKHFLGLPSVRVF